MFIFLGGCRLRHLSWITKLTLQFRDSTIQHHAPNCFRPNNVTWPLRWRSYPCVGRLGQVGGWSIHGRRWRQCCRSFGCSYAATFVWRFLGAIVMQEPPRLVENINARPTFQRRWFDPIGGGGKVQDVLHILHAWSVESWDSEIFVCALFPLNKTKGGPGLVNMIVAPIFTRMTPLKHAQVRHACCKRVLQSLLWCILH